MSETTEITYENILDFLSLDEIDNFKKNIGKVDINKEIEYNLDFGTILHHVICDICTTDEILNIVLEAGADINKQNEKNGKTPLHIAVEVKNHYILKYLLDKGADYSIQDKFWRTPKEDALVNNDHKAINIIDFYINVIKPIVNYDSLNRDHSLLLTSIWNDDLDGIQKQIGLLFYLNQSISFFGPALHTALAICLEPNSGPMNIFLKSGADINKENTHGYTPLHLSIIWKDFIMFCWLLDNGASLDKKDKYGFTSLDLIKIYKRKGWKKIIKFKKSLTMHPLNIQSTKET